MTGTALAASAPGFRIGRTHEFDARKIAQHPDVVAAHRAQADHADPQRAHRVPAALIGVTRPNPAGPSADGFLDRVGDLGELVGL